MFSGTAWSMWRHMVVQSPSFFTTMQEVTPLLLSRISCAAGNGRFWNIHCTHPMSPCDYNLFFKIERTTARDPVQHKILTYPCYRAVNTEHQQRWTCWCTTPSNIWQNVKNRERATILKVHKCCTSVNKTMSEISNCCQYFLSNLCIKYLSSFFNW